MLWVDKHRPADFSDLILHPSVNRTLQRVAGPDMPHLLLCGPSGAGKRTRVGALLRELYGPAASNLRLEHRTVPVTDSKTMDVAVLNSPFHMEVNPTDAGGYDRAVVMHVVRDVASSRAVVASTRVAFKVVVLHEVDGMTRAAQQALRRTMERCMASCRIVLMCTSASRVVGPLRSRCLSIRVPLPDAEGVGRCIARTCERAAVPLPPPATIAALVEKSGRNLRRAILMLEACRGDYQNNAPPTTDWERTIAVIAKNIVEEQTPKQLYEVRQKFYDLLCQCIPPTVVMRTLINELFKGCPASVHTALAKAAADADGLMCRGSKPIIHLESFVAQAMSILSSAVTVVA